MRWITTSGSKTSFPVEKLTERRFRSVWGKSGKRGEPTDRRFARCVPLLEAAMAAADRLPRPYRNLMDKPGIRKAIIELMRDGKRRNVGQIAGDLDGKLPGLTTDQVGGALKDIQKKHLPLRRTLLA
jgi:hypothetical protein